MDTDTKTSDEGWCVSTNTERDSSQLTPLLLSQTLNVRTSRMKPRFFFSNWLCKILEVYLSENHRSPRMRMEHYYRSASAYQKRIYMIIRIITMAENYSQNIKRIFCQKIVIIPRQSQSRLYFTTIQ